MTARLATGVSGFDDLAQGGLPARRLYVISGPPGSGKTTFSAQFVAAGVRRGQHCLYVTMHETEEELIEDMSGYEFGFGEVVRSDSVRFLNLVTEQGRQALQRFGDRAGLEGRLTGIIEEAGVDRVVVDSTMLLQHFFENPDQETTAFISALKQTDATTVLISEMTDPSSYTEEHYLAHGVVFLHNFLEGSGMVRGVQILKMRGTPIDADIRHLEFTDRGLRVSPERTVET